MKVSVIISACPNREELFERSLFTYSKQNYDKKEFEIILIDDGDRGELYNLCKLANKQHGLQFQYVKIDPTKSKYSSVSESFGPALTINIGLRISEADIIVITGPETMVAPNNISVASSFKNRKECGYGLVYRSSKDFENTLKTIDWKTLSFNELLDLPGAKADCRTKPPHPPLYWYFLAVARKYALQINGVDERYLLGICGDDDDFGHRMRFSGVQNLFEHRMIGIHQDHSSGDQNDDIHNFRNTKKWQDLKSKNMKLLKETLNKKNPIANKDHIWGDLNTVISREIIKQ